MSDTPGRPPAFLSHPGDPEIPWAQWKITWTAYVTKREIHLNRQLNLASSRNETPGAGTAAQRPPAQQAGAYSDSEKNLDLYMSLGAEGMRLFNGTENATDWERPHKTVLEVCEKLFRRSTNRLLALYQFRNHKQQRGEEARKFEAELRNLARNCDFENAETERREIADALIINCYSDELRQQLFKDFKKPSPEEVLEAMERFEASKRDVKELKQEATGRSVASADKPRYAKASKTAQRHASKPQQNRQNNGKQNLARDSNRPLYCYGCGQNDHLHGSDHCPARGKRCSVCGNYNHFDSVCKQRQKANKKQHSLIAEKSTASNSTQQEESRVRCKLQLQPISGRSRKKITLSFLADSGAEASTITRSEYQRFFFTLSFDRIKHQFD